VVVAAAAGQGSRRSCTPGGAHSRRISRPVQRGNVCSGTRSGVDCGYARPRWPGRQHCRRSSVVAPVDPGDSEAQADTGRRARPHAPSVTLSCSCAWYRGSSGLVQPLWQSVSSKQPSSDATPQTAGGGGGAASTPGSASQGSMAMHGPAPAVEWVLLRSVCARRRAPDLL
jgi:hypothetical protein